MAACTPQLATHPSRTSDRPSNQHWQHTAFNIQHTGTPRVSTSIDDIAHWARTVRVPLRFILSSRAFAISESRRVEFPELPRTCKDIEWTHPPLPPRTNIHCDCAHKPQPHVSNKAPFSTTNASFPIVGSPSDAPCWPKYDGVWSAELLEDLKNYHLEGQSAALSPDNLP